MMNHALVKQNISYALKRKSLNLNVKYNKKLFQSYLFRIQ